MSDALSESVEASAPSNIALIKYMGKREAREGNYGMDFNRPTNSSLSWSLNHLRTVVRLTPIGTGQDEWKALEAPDLLPMSLSQKSRDRFLTHFQLLKEHLGLQGSFLVESANNFPADCGLASSASSFAALTKAAYLLSRRLGGELRDPQETADLSRRGSGSSIRSFFDGWVLWHTEGVRPLEFPIQQLGHQVVVVESAKKQVSSSEAHRRVVNSDLFNGREARAEKRLAQLMQALHESRWPDAFEICWAEFWDMHALFETSSPPFGYMEPGSLQVLKEIRKYWQEHGDGPLVTMDAGANVHFLYRPEQKEMAKELGRHFRKNWMVFSSPEIEAKEKA